MKTVWAFVLFGVGAVVGFFGNRHFEDWRAARQQLPPVPELKLPDPKLTEKKVPESFKVTEKQVAEALQDGSSLVKGWDWAFSENTKVEFVSRRPYGDYAVEVVVKVEDTHAYGLLGRRVAKWNGLVKVWYELVVTDKGENLWYAKTATHLNSKFSPPKRVGGETENKN